MLCLNLRQEWDYINWLCQIKSTVMRRKSGLPCPICLSSKRAEIEESLIRCLEPRIVAGMYHINFKITETHAYKHMSERWLAEVKKYPPTLMEEI